MHNHIQRIPRHVWILIGLALFGLSQVVDFLTSSTLLFLSLKASGILLFLSQFIIRGYNKPKNKTSDIFVFFLFWTFVLIVRGSLLGRFPLNAQSYLQVGIDVVVNRYSGMAFIMPLVALMAFRMDSFYYMKRIGILLCCISLIMILTHWQDVFSPDLQYGLTEIEDESGDFLNIYDITDVCFMGTWVILLLSFVLQYFDKKILFIFIPFLLFAFFGSVVGGRRAASFYNGLFFLIAVFINYKYTIRENQGNTPKKRERTLFRRVFVVALVGGLIYFIVQLASTTNTFDFLLSRVFSGNNSGQFSNSGRERLVADMVDDFNSHPLSWVFGRGVNGSYETHLTSVSIGGRRQSMEWGFLYLILKGGIPYLIMYVYLLLHAFAMGIYHSRNLLSKGLAFICLLGVILLADVYTPSYGIYYFMIWMSYGLLENEKIRQLDDETIKNCFNVKDFGKTIKVN